MTLIWVLSYKEVMQYDTERLKAAFNKFRQQVEEAPLQSVANLSALSVTTVHRIINYGVGRATNVDKVAKALGFRNGRKDVLPGVGGKQLVNR